MLMLSRQVARLGLGEQMQGTKGQRRWRQIKFYSARPLPAAQSEVYGFLHSMTMSGWTVNDIWVNRVPALIPGHLRPVSLTYLTCGKVKSAELFDWR